jgi:hypothetical protein
MVTWFTQFSSKYELQKGLMAHSDAHIHDSGKPSYVILDERCRPVNRFGYMFLTTCNAFER